MPSGGIPTKHARAPLNHFMPPPLFTRADFPSVHVSNTGSISRLPLKQVHVTVVYLDYSTFAVPCMQAQVDNSEWHMDQSFIVKIPRQCDAYAEGVAERKWMWMNDEACE